MPMRTTFIGGGVMAEAMLSRALAERVLIVDEVRIAEPVPTRRDYLATTYAVEVTDDNAVAVADAGLIVLSIKPQQFSSVAVELRGKLSEEQAVLSIIAGLTVKSISKGLKHDAVIRVMPNTPAQVGQGMSVWTATSAVSPGAREIAQSMLGALGQEWYVGDEHYLDMATAISGSGPAYVFAFIEALVDAGVYMGMPRDMATTLAVQTVLGSAALAKETNESAATLRERVTSPGGTTAVALREFEKRGFRSAVMEGAVAAYKKAQELGDKS